jgi:transcriptional regulator with XRE-family HTH domain
MTSKNTFAERLKFLIEKHNTTQKEVAYDFAMTKGMMSKYCNRSAPPKPDLLIRFCSYFNCSPEWLRSGIGSHNTPFDRTKIIRKKSGNVRMERACDGYEITFFVSDENAKELFEKYF